MGKWHVKLWSGESKTVPSYLTVLIVQDFVGGPLNCGPLKLRLYENNNSATCLDTWLTFVMFGCVIKSGGSYIRDLSHFTSQRSASSLPPPCWMTADNWILVKVDRGPSQNRSHGNVVVRLLISHHGEPGLIPGGVAPRFSLVGIVLDVDSSRWVFSGISHIPHPCIPLLLLTLSLHPSQISRLITKLLQQCCKQPVYNFVSEFEDKIEIGIAAVLCIALCSQAEGGKSLLRAVDGMGNHSSPTLTIMLVIRITHLWLTTGEITWCRGTSVGRGRVLRSCKTWIRKIAGKWWCHPWCQASSR
ncbi:hypothetical protein PR048_007772 [Dryococelus australis]|uniref:Uncharacterized protein n=1 Tax=Dryococelus australis TaxID=614101 RepID=A0ABQ9HV77_9NEOP|nr:hypothetical protein PR048_007772 [Dryococelus australis]